MSVIRQTRLAVRPLAWGDRDTVLEVLAGMGATSRRRRFLAPKPRLTGADLRALTAVDEHDHVALVAHAPDGSAIGIARFVRERADPHTADVAVAVVDAWHGRGVGATLADALVRRAREVGVRRITAMLSPDNGAAVRLLHHVPGDVARLAIDEHAVEFAVTLDLRAG